MKTLIAVATKHTEADFKNTRLAKSLASHKEKQSIVSYTLTLPATSSDLTVNIS